MDVVGCVARHITGRVLNEVFTTHVVVDEGNSFVGLYRWVNAYFRLDEKDVVLRDVLGDFALVMVVNLGDGGGATCGVGPNLIDTLEPTSWSVCV